MSEENSRNRVLANCDNSIQLQIESDGLPFRTRVYDGATGRNLVLSHLKLEFNSSLDGVVKVGMGHATAFGHLSGSGFAGCDVYGRTDTAHRFRIVSDGSIVGTRLFDDAGRPVEWTSIDWEVSVSDKEARISYLSPAVTSALLLQAPISAIRNE